MHFLSDYNIRSCGWFNFGEIQPESLGSFDTSFFQYNADVFAEIDDPAKIQLDNELIYPPEYLKICVYDIETTSIDGKFPDPKIEGNKIT